MKTNLLIFAVLFWSILLTSCQNETTEEVTTIEKQNAKSGPSITVTSSSADTKCIGGDAKYGFKFTVDATTFDHFYLGGGGSSFDKLDVLIWEGTSATGTPDHSYVDRESCQGSRFNRTSIVNDATPCSFTSGVLDLKRNTTYTVRLQKSPLTYNEFQITTSNQFCAAD